MRRFLTIALACALLGVAGFVGLAVLASSSARATASARRTTGPRRDRGRDRRADVADAPASSDTTSSAATGS